jgi:hypothetical protein
MWALVCSKRGPKEWPISPERGPFRHLGEVHPQGILRQKTANFVLGPESTRVSTFWLGEFTLNRRIFITSWCQILKFSLLVMKQICPDPHIQRLSLGEKARVDHGQPIFYWRNTQKFENEVISEVVSMARCERNFANLFFIFSM